MGQPHPIHALFLRAIATGALVLACEATVVRFSDAPPPWTDIVWSGAALVGLPLLAGVVAYNLPWRRGRLLLVASSWLGLCVVATALAAPLHALGTPLILVLGLLLTAALTWAAANRKIPAVPDTTTTCALLLAAWLLSYVPSGALPSRETLLGVLGCWLALGLIAAADRRVGITLSAALLIGTGSLPRYAPGWSGAAHGRGPDILLITVDTLRNDDAQQMSALERIGEHGTALSAQAVSPWTLPSAATLLTGLPPSEHGAGRLERGTSGLADNLPLTLAERLHRAGYHTAAVVDRNRWLTPTMGLDRGFEVFAHSSDPPPNAGSSGTGRMLFGRLADHLPSQGVVAHPARRVSQRAHSLVLAKRSGPLFLWVHFMDPHLPYTHGSTSEWIAQATRESILSRPLDDENREALREAYRTEVREVDAAIVDLLRRLPPSPNRVVLLTADHGEEFWDHDGFEHGHAVWQELLDVPLAVDGLEVGVLPGPVSQLDVAPTLLAAAGRPHDDLPGWDLAAPPAQDERLLMSGNLAHGGAPARSWAVRQGPWKAILGEAGPLLYKLDEDPLEQRDRSLDAPEQLRRLEIVPWLDLGPDRVPAFVRDDEGQALRALGYVVDEASP